MPNADHSPGWDAAIRAGTRTILLAQIASQIISLLVLSALFHFVSTSSFGLMGLIVPWMGLPRMLALVGVQVALIQPDDLSQQQKTGLFWINLIIGAASAVFVVISGFVLAEVYGTPELRSLGVALSATSLVMALAASHQSLLERRLQMKQLTFSRLAAQGIAGGVAVAAALAQWEVWALVVQQYVELIILVIALWWCEPWRPDWRFQRSNLRGLMRLGGYYSLSNLALYVSQNIDKVLLALFVGRSEAGRAAVGMYCQAFNLVMRPVYLMVQPLAGVFMPGMSRSQRDAATYAELVSRMFRMTSIVLMPCGVGLALVSLDLMQLMGGDKWKPAGWILCSLAPVIMVQGMINLSGSVFSSAGKTRAMFVATIVYTAVLIQGILAGYWVTTQLSVELAPELARATGVGAGFALTTVLALALPYLKYCCQTAGVQLGPTIKPLIGPLVASLAMGVLVFVIGRNMPQATAWIRLPAMVLTGIVSYALFARREIKWFWSTMAHRG